MSLVDQILETYKKEIAALKKGEKIEVKCPSCNNKLVLIKSFNLGRLHIRCSRHGILYVED